MNDLVKEYDLNKDGQIEETEIETVAKMEAVTNKDERADAQCRMTWWALFGMLLYPLLVILSAFYGFDKTAEILGNMAATYFVSVAGVVAAFFGTEAYKSKS